ncbi:MAG: hypothetical protein GW873_05070 [Nitrospirae bacterium]|nr:hypothetical protein [Nitrospirota bacterium]
MNNKVDALTSSIPNILIIDDDKGMCKTLSHILELDGYRISTAILPMMERP